MARGKGQRRYVCFCRLPTCGKNFMARREDARTCSDAHRKALNRLLGGRDVDRGRQEESNGVTDLPNGVFRVLLDGKWIATYPTRAAAEAAVAGWSREWDGVFRIVQRRKEKGKR